MRIGFFDSGIGGLTVLAEALDRIPGAEFLYFADTASVPYGNKPKEEVRRCVFRGVEFLASRGMEALVVACNTATSVAIEDLRRTYPFPIIGMEPAVKPALHLVAQKPGSRVLALATDMTLKEAKFQALVRRIDRESRVDHLSLQGLVALAEAFAFDSEQVGACLREATAPLDLGTYGAVVLGCTHFPFFRPQLARLFPPGTSLVDGNRGTVANVIRLLKGSLPAGGPPSRVAWFESGQASTPGRFQRYLDYYRNLEICKA
jgi:glutamate racemase